MSSNQALGGKRKLTLIDAVAQSVGFMGPVFSIAFLVPLVVGITSVTGDGAGTGAALSVVIATIGVFGLGWIIAEYTKKVQSAGSLYDYVTDGLGGRVGAASGWLYYLGIIALGSGILVMIGGVVHDTLISEGLSSVMPYWGWDLLLFVIVGSIVYLGVALSTRVQLALAVISVTVILIFSIYVIVKSGGLHHIGKGFTIHGSPNGFKGVMFGVLYGVLLFTGFETSANLGEETENPGRNIPRAIIFSILAIAVFYVIGTFAQISGFHFNLTALGKQAGGPLFALGSPSAMGGYGSTLIRRLVELVVVLDMIAVLIGATVSASRGIFALSRDERLPKAMGSVSRRGTPLGSSVSVLAIYALVIVLTLTTTVFALPNMPEYVSFFSWNSTFGGFALVLIYLLVAVGALRGLKTSSRAKLYTAVTVGGVVGLGAVYGAIYKVPAPTIWAPWAAVVILLVSLLVAAAMKIAPSGRADFSPLTKADQAPQKL